MQRLQHHGLPLGRGIAGLRICGQGLQPGTLNFLPMPKVDAKILSGRAQVGARLARAAEAADKRFTDETQEGVMREIGRLGCIAQPAIKPTSEPRVVVQVEPFDRWREGYAWDVMVQRLSGA